ncbi:MAG: UvrD-helicase domain-containing protein [Rectinemataceae bacterium]
MSYLDALDEGQRRAVLMRENGVVTAGAGAGKTRALAIRYLDLCLQRGLDPGEILALTFTRKAAAEMYGRIHAALAGSDDPVAAEKLARFSEARITTLDSFCAEIVRGSAEDYGYPPDFAIDEETAASITREEAFSFALEKRSSPGLAELLASYRFEDIVEIFFVGVARTFVHPSADGADPFAAMPDRTRAELGRLKADTLTRLDAAAARAAELEASIAAPGKDCVPTLAAFRNWGAYRRASCTDSGLDAATAFLPLGLRGYSSKDPDQTEVKSLAKMARDTLAPLLADLAAAEAFLPAYDALMQLLGEFAVRVRDARRAAAVMTFGDLGVCAVDVLERRRDVRERWKRRIRSVMIDEFQDDNELQKRLLYLLSEKQERTDPSPPEAADLEYGKLFFVGDEKQSIYLFRGAEVSVFRKLAIELAGANADETTGSVSLDTNYRSTPSLVAFFNALFGRVMADASEDFEARYSPMRAGAPDRGFVSHISYRIIPREEEDNSPAGGTDDSENTSSEIGLSADARLAEDLAGFIRNSVLRELPVRGDDGNPHPARYEDFAVLLRSTSKQHLVEGALRRFDIPFDAASPRGLFLESPAHDLFSALSLALDSSDRRAYAAFLRSPAAGLSDDALVEVLAAGLPPFEWQGNFAREDATAFARGKALYAELRSRIDRIPLAELLNWLWHMGGYRLDLLSRAEGRPFSEHFDYLFHMAASADAGGLNLAEFLARLSPLLGSSERIEIEDVPRDTIAGVRIMTVHKAKGLEFPVVLLPWIDSKGSSGGAGGTSGAPGIWRFLPSCGVTVDLKPFDEPKAKAANVLHRQARELDAARERAETKRLFYVACTRAADHLVFFGREPKSADNDRASFHSLLVGGNGLRDASGLFPDSPECLEIVEVGGRASAETPFTEPVSDFALAAVATPVAAMAAAYASAKVLTRSFPKVSVAASAVATAAECARSGFGTITGTITGTAIGADPASAGIARQELESESAHGMAPDAFGTLCHALIAHRVERGSGLERFIPEEKLFADMGEKSRALAMAEAESFAQGFFRSELWKSLSNLPRIETEKPFLLRLDGEPLIEGRMDLYAEGGDSATIVDFKTDRKEDSSLHEVQLALYRMAARGFSGAAKVESWLFWLRSGTARRCETEYDETELAAWAKTAADASDARSEPVLSCTPEGTA